MSGRKCTGRCMQCPLLKFLSSPDGQMAADQNMHNDIETDLCYLQHMQEKMRMNLCISSFSPFRLECNGHNLTSLYITWLHKPQTEHPSPFSPSLPPTHKTYARQSYMTVSFTLQKVTKISGLGLQKTQVFNISYERQQSIFATSTQGINSL